MQTHITLKTSEKKISPPEIEISPYVLQLSKSANQIKFHNHLTAKPKVTITFYDVDDKGGDIIHVCKGPKPFTIPKSKKLKICHVRDDAVGINLSYDIKATGHASYDPVIIWESQAAPSFLKSAAEVSAYLVVPFAVFALTAVAAYALGKRIASAERAKCDS